MAGDELDRLLSEDDGLVPSSGFAASVMEAVHRDASAPPAIAFPWTRALPGLIAMGVTLIVAIWSGLFASRARQPSSGGGVESLLAYVANAGTSPEVMWLVFAAIVTAVPAILVLRLTRRSL